MTLDFFYKNYDLKEGEIKSAIIKDGKLKLNVVLTAYLELIANGYRPEMDLDQNIVFTFDVDKENKEFKNPAIDNVEYKDNILYITINNEVIDIKENNILVKEGF